MNDLLRHTLATLAYRGGKAVRGAPDCSPVSGSGRCADVCEILAHVGDLFDWALSIARGQQPGRIRRRSRGRRKSRAFSPRSRRSMLIWPRRPAARDAREAVSSADRRCAYPCGTDRDAAPAGGRAGEGRKLLRREDRYWMRRSRSARARVRVLAPCSRLASASTARIRRRSFRHRSCECLAPNSLFQQRPREIGKLRDVFQALWGAEHAIEIAADSHCIDTTDLHRMIDVRDHVFEGRGRHFLRYSARWHPRLAPPAACCPPRSSRPPPTSPTGTRN